MKYISRTQLREHSDFNGQVSSPRPMFTGKCFHWGENTTLTTSNRKKELYIKLLSLQSWDFRKLSFPLKASFFGKPEMKAKKKNSIHAVLRYDVFSSFQHKTEINKLLSLRLGFNSFQCFGGNLLYFIYFFYWQALSQYFYVLKSQ